MKKVCENCRFRKRGVLKEPCSTGAYQLLLSHRCFLWKPERWYQRIIKAMKNLRFPGGNNGRSDFDYESGWQDYHPL